MEPLTVALAVVSSDLSLCETEDSRVFRNRRLGELVTTTTPGQPDYHTMGLAWGPSSISIIKSCSFSTFSLKSDDIHFSGIPILHFHIPCTPSSSAKNLSNISR